MKRLALSHPSVLEAAAQEVLGAFVCLTGSSALHTESSNRMPADFADQTPGRWDGSGTISDPCAEAACRFYGEYHRFSGHTIE